MYYTVGQRISVHNLITVNEGSIGTVDAITSDGTYIVKLDVSSEYGRRYVRAGGQHLTPSDK
jgi:hypothetical protein